DGFLELGRTADFACLGWIVGAEEDRRPEREPLWPVRQRGDRRWRIDERRRPDGTLGDIAQRLVFAARISRRPRRRGIAEKIGYHRAGDDMAPTVTSISARHRIVA